MGKVLTGLIVILGLWAGAEIFAKGPSRAFDDMWAYVVGDAGENRVVDARSTARRSGDAVERARDEVEARRERMLGE